MVVTVDEEQLKMVLDRLDSVRLEVLRLRAMLLPEDEPTKEEEKEIEKARKEMEEDQGIALEDLIKEMS